MDKQQILKAVNSFRGANREFSQEMGPIVEGILDLIDEGGSGGSSDAVKYTQQALTEEQQSQARTNIGGASAASVIAERDRASAAELEIMDALDGRNAETVTVLPEASASTVGKIYYVGPDSDGEYARYRGIESNGSYSFLPLGSTEMDLTDYATEAELSQLDQELIVGETISLPLISTRNLRPTNGGTVQTGNNGYSYIAEVKKDDVLTVNFAIPTSGNYLRAGFTTQYPAGGVAVTGYLDRNYTQTQVVMTAPADGYLLMECSVDFTTISVSKPTGDTIGHDVFILKQKKVGVGSFENVPAPVNILDPSACESGFLDSSGSISSNTDYITTPKIPVDANSTVSFAFCRFVAQYDADGVFISGKYTDLNNAESATVTMAATAAFFRVSVAVANYLYRAMVVKGTLPADYAPYRISVPFLPSYSKYDGKKVVILGDSTTAYKEEWNAANIGMYIRKATNMSVQNCAMWSARAALDQSSAEVINAFAICSLADGIATGVWTAQDIIGQTTGYEDHEVQLEKLKAIDFSKVDFLVILIGTNDLVSDTPFEIDGQPLSKNSVNGAIRYAVSTILGEYPQIKILLCSPIFRFDPTTGADYEVSGRKIQDFVDDYNTLGEELHIPVLDMLNIGVNKYNCDLYYGENGGDGTHENNAMKEIIGNRIAGALTSLY